MEARRAHGPPETETHAEAAGGEGRGGEGDGEGPRVCNIQKEKFQLWRSHLIHLTFKKKKEFISIYFLNVTSILSFLQFLILATNEAADDQRDMRGLILAFAAHQTCPNAAFWVNSSEDLVRRSEHECVMLFVSICQACDGRAT